MISDSLPLPGPPGLVAPGGQEVPEGHEGRRLLRLLVPLRAVRVVDLGRGRPPNAGAQTQDQHHATIVNFSRPYGYGYGYTAIWLYGYTAIRLYSYMAIRLYGYTAIRLYGYTAIRLPPTPYAYRTMYIQAPGIWQIT